VRPSAGRFGKLGGISALAGQTARLCCTCTPVHYAEV
jgi:hypothetical protein